MAFSNPPEALLDQQVIALIAAHFRLEAQEVTAYPLHEPDIPSK